MRARELDPKMCFGGFEPMTPSAVWRLIPAKRWEVIALDIEALRKPRAQSNLDHPRNIAMVLANVARLLELAWAIKVCCLKERRFD